MLSVDDLIVGKRYIINTNTHHDFNFYENIRAKFLGKNSSGQLKFFKWPDIMSESYFMVDPSDLGFRIVEQRDAWWEIMLGCTTKFTYAKYVLVILSWMMLGSFVTLFGLLVLPPLFRLARSTCHVFITNKVAAAKNYFRCKLQEFLNSSSPTKKEEV